MKIVISSCLVPLHLNDPLISFLIPEPSGGSSSAPCPGSHEKFTAPLLSCWSSPRAALSCLAVPCVLRSAPRPHQLPAPIPLLERPFPPLQPGPDIRNWLRKCSNGYQIFGNCLGFSELNMCSVQAASTGTTWPHGSLRLADFSFPFFFFFSFIPPLLEKTRKLLPDNTWCKCKIMLWNDCKHAVFQMFDETVKKQHKEGSTVSVRDSAGFHMKKPKNPKPQHSDLINSRGSAQLTSYLGF